MSNPPSLAVFEAIVDTSIDAVVVINRDGDITFWNNAASVMFGYTKEEVIGRYVHDVLPAHVHRDKANKSFHRFRECGHGPLVGHIINVTGLRKNGDTFDVQFALNSVTIDGHVFAYAFLRDVSHVVALRKDLERSASIDELTNILNRRSFMKASDVAFGMAVRHEEPMTMLMLDLDHFKDVNDRYGHHAGDVALSSFAACISRITRAEDIFGRIGGEEFCIVLPKTGTHGARVLAEEIRAELAGIEIVTDEARFRISVSVGVSVLKHGDDFAILQRRADQALYQAKAAGRDQVMLG